MPGRLTVIVDDAANAGLHQRVGKRRIGRFLWDLARPYVVDQAMARPADQARTRMAEQIATVSKQRIGGSMGQLAATDMDAVGRAMCVQLRLWMVSGSCR